MSDRKRLARVERALERNEEAARRLMMVSRAEVASLQQRQASVLAQCHELGHSAAHSGGRSTGVSFALSRRLVETGWSAASALEEEREQAAAILAARHDEWSKRNIRLDAVRRLVARREAAAADEARLREARELQDLVATASMSSAASIERDASNARDSVMNDVAMGVAS